jgi:hypothetical protein
MKIQRRLRVYPHWKEDVFKDIARIPQQDRGEIREGSVCTVTVNGLTKHLLIRGLEQQLNGGIMLDEITRNTLQVQEGMPYDFTIKQGGWYQQLKWACTLADAGPRISAWLAVISVILGIVGLVLGLFGIVISMR